MTFEEFFKKKKIDLAALQSGQPGLFSEFKEHYEAMGEKSFDHTKKYWFNKLRMQYHLAPEIKEEKVIIENRLAEQTIVESLTEPATANVGFKPRFKASATAAKPADDSSNKKDLPIKESATVTKEVNEATVDNDPNPAFVQEKAKMQQAADQMPRTTDGDEEGTKAATTLKTGFKPRFNMKMAQGSAPQTKEFQQENVNDSVQPAESSAEAPLAQKPADFKPRFNAAKMASEKEDPVAEDKPVEENHEERSVPVEPSTETHTAPKPAGFKPRFNAAKMAVKKEEPADRTKQVEESPAEAPALTEPSAQTPVAPKPAGFKPRFNAAKMAPKKGEPVAEDKPAEKISAKTTEPVEHEAVEPKVDERETKPAEEAASKLGFKPRFNPKTTKPQPPKTED